MDSGPGSGAGGMLSPETAGGPEDQADVDHLEVDR